MSASPILSDARRMLEYCRFSYKMYAQTCAFPLDPFYESWGPGFKVLPSARDRLIAHLHTLFKSESEQRKFDPIEYVLDKTPSPAKGVVYRGGIDERFILLQPREIDRSISVACGFDATGKKVDDGVTTSSTGLARCGYFQGRTGPTKTHPRAGWPSWLGAAVYDARSDELVIVFRGSRSGDGGRALLGAQFKSKGSPDWVTDMNHLKGVEVSKFGGASLAAGFFYAYESCRLSLTAAVLYALKGAKPKTVYVTGHSLGGALAQNAYIDLVCGTLKKNLEGVLDGARVLCFPISSPPILLGQSAQHWLSFHADASSVYHFYNPKDAVHASPLVTTSKFTVANDFIKLHSHPLTAPWHIGSTVALPCNAAFPDAHEPEQVWLGMHGGRSESTFWPTFQLNVATDDTIVSDLPTGLEPALKEALKNSIDTPRALKRAELWRSVAKSEARKELAQQGESLFAKASSLLDDLGSGQLARMDQLRVKESIRVARRALVEGGYKDPSKHSASSSCYWTMLLRLAAGQVVLEA